MPKTFICLLLTAAALCVPGGTTIADAPAPSQAAPGEMLAGVTRAELEPCYNEMMAGNYFSALGLANKLVDKYPDDANVLNQRARVFAMMGEYQKAIADDDRAIELQPKFYGWYQMRGYIYLNLGDFERAFEDFSKAVELNSKDILSVARKGECRRWQGNSKEALKFYQQAQKMNPTGEEPQVFVACAYYQLGEYEKLKDVAEQLKFKFSGGNSGYEFAGLYLRHKGEYEKAIDEFTTEIKIFPKVIGAYTARADCRARTGDLVGAREDIQIALETELNALADKLWHRWSAYRLAAIYAVRSTTWEADDAGKAKAAADIDRAFELLNKGINKGFRAFDLMGHDNDLDALRKDDRWKELMAFVKVVQEAEK
ncbi:MAG: tetratricopeptide repeat protein [Planctomycetes bacterium]|nr:tetratricopeptide repeat protein [Planctomycetota bacterium]